ncbi:hypothetical protein [Streptomyces anulatus]|uniref:hypothetical protein n=1 Tax=Streptomyces anulatus TaxID=1892 RepID=UPI00364E8399
MKSKRNSQKLRQNRQSARLRHWLARRRRIMTAHLLRGACYGIGTGSVGLVFWWVESNL